MELFEGLRLRWISKKLGLERIVLKESKLRAYFVTNPQSTFYETETFKQIIQLINSPVGIREKISLKQSSKSLIVVKDHVKTLKMAREVLEKMLL
jgi:transcription-repair coupling factor (superfamily II helicase)